MSDPAFGVYIHWPYCARICPYCDFTVYRDRGEDHAVMRAAIAADIAGHAARIGARRVDTIFLGGGTPSLLSPQDIDDLIGAVARHFSLADDVEITLEANPEDRARFAAQAAAGVNRFSVGVQALDDAALAQLGRAHGREDALAALDAAAATGARVTADFIYARHGQSLASWRRELTEALALPVEHLSLYELTVKEGTAFERAFARRALMLPDADGAAEFYLATQEACDAAGCRAYEISNHARFPAARARHNLIYWTGGEWIGAGPGASGRISIDGARIATRAHAGLKPYLTAVNEVGVGWETAERLDREGVAEEALIMGLRLSDGIDRQRLEALRGRPFDQAIVDDLVEEGLLETSAGRVRLTVRGRLVADRINLLLA